MRYEFKINWTPKKFKTLSIMGFNEGKLVSSVEIGIFSIESPVEINHTLLKEYLLEATKVYEKSLNGKIYLERI